MYVVKKLRLNRFKPSPVVSGRRLFEMFGLKEPQNTQQTAKCINEPIPFGAKKTQALGLAEEIAMKADAFKQQPESTQPLPRVQPKEQ